jgi:hypothetical protein
MASESVTAITTRAVGDRLTTRCGIGYIHSINDSLFEVRAGFDVDQAAIVASGLAESIASIAGDAVSSGNEIGVPTAHLMAFTAEVIQSLMLSIQRPIS